jgi:hypothetical protein
VAVNAACLRECVLVTLHLSELLILPDAAPLKLVSVLVFGQGHVVQVAGAIERVQEQFLLRERRVQSIPAEQQELFTFVGKKKHRLRDDAGGSAHELYSGPDG